MAAANGAENALNLHTKYSQEFAPGSKTASAKRLEI
jgi:hypothetical protein